MERTCELIKQAKEGNKEAQSILVEENSGLIWSVVKRFQGRGYDKEDLFQIGSIGLLKCIENFDLERNVKFSTYAVPVILGEIKRLFRDGGTIKVSRSIKELSMRLVRERERFSIQQGREPTVSELCELSGESEEAVTLAMNVALPPVSLTESSDEDDRHGQIDIPVDAPDIEIADRLSLRQVIASLEAEDRKLIYLRYFQNKTQMETAKQLGMSQVQVSRREKKLLTLMREQLK